MNERQRRSFIDRLRTGRGPSFDLLVQLDHHRVLTTGQVARLTAAPERTTSYRLGRLQAARLVDCARPGREAGSAPRHWWLTPIGARLVAGVAPAEGRRPSAMFAAHTATIAEVWLAVLEHGPSVGITPTSWRPDRSGWQTWQTGTRGSGPTETVTPDAVLRANLTGPAAAGPTAALIEVDLGTETQTQLGRKLGRYLAYAGDRAWASAGLPHCPPLLLLTTTPARAATWLRAAGKAAARARREAGLDYRFAGRGRAGQEVAAGERLVIAACGLVREPGAAVTGPVWQLAASGRDDADDVAQVVTLVELLAERVTAGRVAAGHHARLAADTRAAERMTTLWNISRDDRVGELLGDGRAGDALRRLVGNDLDVFAATHPRLVQLLLSWWPHRHDGQAPTTHAKRGQLRTVLLAEHRRMWVEQVRAVLAAPGGPRTVAAAAVLQAGDLLPGGALADLAEGQDRAVAAWQQTYNRYRAARDAEVTARWDALSWRERRRTDRAELVAAYDSARLLACDICAAATPRRTPPDPTITEPWDGPYTAGEHDDVEPGDPCPLCGHGHLGAYERRHQVTTLATRLEQLRARLAE